jgi:uncharacterized phage infection (PIP) family protein YhgE
MRILLAAGIVVLAVGCGSSSNTTTTSPVAAATAWAGGVCLAFSTYKSDLQQAAHALKSNPSSTQLYESVTAAKTASTDFRSTMAAVGPAPAQAKPAQQAIDNLKHQIQDDVNAIKSTLDGVSSASDVKAALPKVGTELDKLVADLKQGGATLKGLPSGTLKQGFQEAPNCKNLGV